MGLGSLLRTRSLPPDGAEVPNPAASDASSFDLTAGGWGRPHRVLPAPTEREAMSVPAFWRGHNYVCGTVGLLPVAAWRDTTRLEPQPGILRQPDIEQTPMAFWAGIASAVTLYGNAVCHVLDTDRLGYPTVLKPIHPTLAAVQLGGNPQEPTIGGWYLAGRLVDPSEVWHVKSFIHKTGWPLGMGILDAAPDGVASARAVGDYAASYFAGGGVPPGVLKIHRPEVTQDQADEAKALWVEKQAGRAEPAVLNDLTDFTPLAFRPIESQMIEARQFSLVDVALLWGLPPSKLGANLGGGTYRNAEMEEVQARNDGVGPWARLLEQAVSLRLLPRGQRAEWRLDAYLRTDTEGRFKAYQIAMGGPGPESKWLMADEVRGLEGLDPLEDAIEDEVTAVEDEPPGAPEPVVSGGQGGPDVPNRSLPLPTPVVNGNGAHHG
jgi:HK97 family phage portal protein